MASSAHAPSVQTGAVIHAPQGRTPHKPASGSDSFAEMLDQHDATAKDMQAASPTRQADRKTARTDKPAKAGRSNNKADNKADARADAKADAKAKAEAKADAKASDDKAAADQSSQSRAADASDAAAQTVATDAKQAADEAKAADDARQAANDAANDNVPTDVALPQPALPPQEAVILAAAPPQSGTQDVTAADENADAAPIGAVAQPGAAAQTGAAAQPDAAAQAGAATQTGAATQAGAAAQASAAAEMNAVATAGGNTAAEPAEEESAAATAAKPGDTSKTSAPRPATGKKEQPVAGANQLAKDAGKDFGKDFRTALHDAAPDAAQAPQKPAAEADIIAKSVEAPAPARPSADLNTITLTAPAPSAPQGADKPVVTAGANIPAPPPPATPNLNQMAVDVAARSHSGAKQFDIRLDPPELGRVEVRLSIDAHGKAEAHLTADQPQTLDLLQKDAPALARALREAGLNVQQDGLNFSLKHQPQQNLAGGDGQPRHGARSGFNGATTNSETSQQDDGAYVRRSLGVLDIRV